MYGRLFHGLRQSVGGMHHGVAETCSKYIITVKQVWSLNDGRREQLFEALGFWSTVMQLIALQNTWVHLFVATDSDLVFCYKIELLHGKFLICTYPQQTWKYTKKLFITKESRFTTIYQKLLKIYLVIKINLN